MEYVSTMISEVVNTRDWKAFSLNNHNLNISRLLFADDVLLFAKSNPHTIDIINYIIDSFCKTSGMEINFEKSKLWLSPKIPLNRKLEISNSLRINVTSNLGSYLGFPLKPKYKTSDFNYVTNKIRQKLQGWKMHTLSFAGRSLLISTTLNQIHCYHMHVFSLPQKVLNQIDKINRNFLWGHNETSSKTHFINWDKVTSPKFLGGLGLKKSNLLNATFMAKLR